MMAEMTGGQAVVRQMVREGVDTLFGLPGVQLDWAYDALYEEREHIAVYVTRHELATAYAVSSPVICVAGQVPTAAIDKGYGMLHEIPRQREVLRSVTKWVGRA